ncbi:hypothetical protein B0H16DRAFT_1384093 [Mycena metata]|uniref:Aminoglycoside phosphotransferase domain-containing protein n=1 Tax=Mycena metata TaxID=1033252 RepID=A0AAD7MP38_9AGAR|nr:hypothetical protein B0H16DRAFT_1384093 [Mycena metata]
MSNGDASASSWSSDSSSCWDDWPADFDGTGLFQSLDRDEPPIFRFDVQCVLAEVEGQLQSAVVDIPKVGKGSNYFGMHLRLEDGSDVLVRMARRDVNWPRHTEGDADELLKLVKQQVLEVQFEAEIYQLLRSHRDILASHLLYYRAPTYRPSGVSPPQNILGRAFFVFKKTEGVNNVWPDDLDKRLYILEQCARIRAALFSFVLPPDFIASWLARRIPCAKSIPAHMITPTRDFALRLLSAKINETIPDQGGLIGWEEDHHVVGPNALRAKTLLLRLLPLILPAEEGCDNNFYRLVLDHGDFGIHNMTITDTPPTVTSLYDWEAAEIVPAILSDPQMSVYVDLELDGDGLPAISRVWEGITKEDRLDCLRYAEHYFQTLGKRAPEYMKAIKAAKDPRRIWFALKSWRGDDPEQYFGALGSWAQERMSEVLSVDDPKSNRVLEGCAPP